MTTKFIIALAIIFGIYAEQEVGYQKLKNEATLIRAKEHYEKTFEDILGKDAIDVYLITAEIGLISDNYMYGSIDYETFVLEMEKIKEAYTKDLQAENKKELSNKEDLE